MKKALGKLVLILISFILLALLTRSFPGHREGDIRKKESTLSSEEIREIIDGMHSAEED